MLEERQSEVERLQQELLVVPAHLQADFDASIRKLQSTTGAAVTSKCEVVEERDEDLYVLNEEKVSHCLMPPPPSSCLRPHCGLA